MRKILLVIPSLACSGGARLLCLLAAGLPRDRVRVCVLGGPVPWCDELRGAGVELDVLGWRRDVDLRPLVRLRRLIVQQRPDVVHAWGFAAAWALVLVGCRPARLFLSVLPPKRKLSLAERWLLRRCRRIVAFGQGEAGAWLRQRASPLQVEVAPPAAELFDEAVAAAHLPGLPEGARVIVTVGPLERHKGCREAVWTLDILRCLYDDLHLVIVGEGPDEERIRQFAHTLRLADAVHFTGAVGSVQPWLARAQVVWAAALRPGGRQTVLEAMAAGRPVVASRLPSLAEVVVDGQTGYLVGPADKAERAKQTRILLDRAELRRDMGEAGRARVATYFSPGAMVAAVAGIYQQG